MDYTTQGDPNQVTPPTYINTAQATAQNQFLRTNNFFVPDSSNRCIHEIRDKVFHTGYLENGNNAYLLELPGLKEMLHTSRFLMDEMSGQFYAVYGNTYQRMSTRPMLEQTWGTGELIDQLAVARHAFGYAGLSGPTPPLNQPQPAACTISNHEHKKDLINRLKRSDPHNILAYETEMTRHMILHDDVLGRILTILKKDNYYRTLEELPVINSLTTYEDIQLFPELYDTTTIIERVTGEADLIERQLKQPRMYPPPKTPLPSTSGFVPKPSSTFQPIASAAPPPAVNTHQTDRQQSAEMPPGSSLPSGQCTPIGSASITSTPSQHTLPQSVVPPQPATPQSHNPDNIHTHTHNPKTHHNHPPLHNLGNSLLLGQILICPPSLSFQLQRHINPCPAHHYNTFLSPQMVKE